jgi:hypothetical protein
MSAINQGLSTIRRDIRKLLQQKSLLTNENDLSNLLANEQNLSKFVNDAKKLTQNSEFWDYIFNKGTKKTGKVSKIDGVNIQRSDSDSVQFGFKTQETILQLVTLAENLKFHKSHKQPPKQLIAKSIKTAKRNYSISVQKFDSFLKLNKDVKQIVAAHNPDSLLKIKKDFNNNNHLLLKFDDGLYSEPYIINKNKDGSVDILTSHANTNNTSNSNFLNQKQRIVNLLGLNPIAIRWHSIEGIRMIHNGNCTTYTELALNTFSNLAKNVGFDKAFKALKNNNIDLSKSYPKLPAATKFTDDCINYVRLLSRASNSKKCEDHIKNKLGIDAKSGCTLKPITLKQLSTVSSKPAAINKNSDNNDVKNNNQRPSRTKRNTNSTHQLFRKLNAKTPEDLKEYRQNKHNAKLQKSLQSSGTIPTIKLPSNLDKEPTNYYRNKMTQKRRDIPGLVQDIPSEKLVILKENKSPVKIYEDWQTKYINSNPGFKKEENKFQIDENNKGWIKFSCPKAEEDFARHLAANMSNGSILDKGILIAKCEDGKLIDPRTNQEFQEGEYTKLVHELDKGITYQDIPSPKPTAPTPFAMTP